MTTVSRLALAVALIAWFAARKGYKLLTFSVMFAIGLAAVAAAFFQARSTSKESYKHFATSLRQFANDTQNYVEGGSIGKTPSFKSTGDPFNDEILQLLSEFYQSVGACVS